VFFVKEKEHNIIVCTTIIINIIPYNDVFSIIISFLFLWGGGGGLYF